MIIDATDLIVGRFATVAAKKAILGEEIHIVNCEKAIITGNRAYLMADYKNKREQGNPVTGPFYHRSADKYVRRMIRGMMNHRSPRGKAAFARLKCYVGVPAEFKDKKLETIKEANASKLPTLKYMRIGEICKLLGAR